MASVRTDNEGRVDMAKHIKRVGPLLLGPKLGRSPAESMIYCLARKEGSGQFFAVKIVTLKKNTETEEVQPGKSLLHTEHSLLTLLKGVKGVVHHHGLYEETTLEEVEIDGKLVKTGNEVTRLCLVLDCFTPNEFSPSYKKLINLEQYVLQDHRLKELEALELFSNILQTVERMHELGNITLDKLSKAITIGNFGLGKQLASDNQALTDQRGTPGYVSPDVISGNPYLGKPSDMWALGVILYMMLYGRYPFFDSSKSELFRKIQSVEYSIPTIPYVPIESIELIKSLLVLNPKERPTCTQVLRIVKNIISTRSVPICDTCVEQVVPFIRPLKTSHTNSLKSKRAWSVTTLSDIEQLLASATTRAEEITMATADPKEAEEDDSTHEPPKKVIKVPERLGSGANAIKLLRVKEEAQVLTVGDMQKLRAIYEYNKDKQIVAAAAARIKILLANIASELAPPPVPARAVLMTRAKAMFL